MKKQRNSAKGDKGSGMNSLRKTVFVLLMAASAQDYSQVRTSVASGLFNLPITWDCFCFPASTDTIVIDSAHTVTLAANTTVGGLAIKRGAELANSNRRIDVFGNYKLDGIHSGSGDIRLRGNNTTIDGSGDITCTGTVDLRDGNKTILSTAKLSNSGGANTVVRSITVTNFGKYISSITVNGSNANSKWINSAGSYVEVSGGNLMNTGVLVASAINNEVVYSEDGNQPVADPLNSTYYHLTVNGTNNKTISNHLTILGDLTLKGSNFKTQNKNLDIHGDFVNEGGTFEEGSGKVKLSGSAMQEMSLLSTEIFNHLEINKSAGNVSLTADIQVLDSLILKSGNLVTASNTITLGSSTTSTGKLLRTGGYVQGKLQRWVSSTATPYSFPIGSSSNYLPASIQFSNLNAGQLLFEFSEALPGDAGLPLPDGADSITHTFNEGIWQMSRSSGLLSDSFNLSLTANGFTSYSITPATRILCRSASNMNWTASGNHVAAVGSTVSRSNVKLIPAEFALGDTTKCPGPAPSTSVITGIDSVCKGTLNVAYSIINNPLSTYQWTITGGTQVSGGSSNQILVNWDTVGAVGKVEVIEFNGCEYGTPVSQEVVVLPVGPNSITGTTTVQENSTSVVYSVNGVSGYTYSWTITGGSQASGGNSSPITVNWGSAGTGTVSVTASNYCGSAGKITLVVDILDYIESVKSGNWTTTSTWDCNCIPGSSDNVIIKQGHTVDLTGATTINDVIIESTGTLNSANRVFTVNGNMTNDGAVSGTNRIELGGSGNTLSGTGSWSGLSGDLRFNSGLHTISSDANIVKTGDVDVRANGTVINRGWVEAGSSLTGQNNTTSVWYNDANATLKVGVNLLSSGVLYASSSGNTVAYMRLGTNNQSIKDPESGIYYNLSIEGNNLNSDKRLTADISILGDLSISSATFDVNTSNYRVNLNGNWINNNGNFNGRSGLVIFSGAHQTISHTSEETFYKMQCSNTDTVLLNCPISVSSDFTVDAGSKFDVNNAGNHQLNVRGHVTVVGTLLLRKAKLLLDGTSKQNVNGSLDIYDLVADNAAGVDLNSGTLTLQNILSIKKGIFNTNNRLTFLSNATRTAMLSDLTGGGSISGNLTVQRYLNEGVGYYMVAPPVTGTTMADWKNEIYMSGFPGSNAPGAGVSVYNYDETTRTGGYTTGYRPATNVTNSLVPGKGWFVYLYSNGITTDLTGPAKTGALSTGTLSYSSLGPSSENGWHLLGNPYPSPILWSHVSTSGLNNGGEAYVLKADGNYAAVAADGVDTIYSSEAFWVQVVNGGGTVNFSESDKVVSNDDYNARLEAPVEFTLPLNMELSYSGKTGYRDYSVLRFGDKEHTQYFENVFGEVRKVSNANATLPNIASYSETDSSNIYYNNLNPQDSTSTIPLKIWTASPLNKSYIYQIEFKGIQEWNDHNHCLILRDTVASTSQKLEASHAKYQFAMNDKWSGIRIFLEERMPVRIQPKDAACYGEKSGWVKAWGGGNSLHTFIWLNDRGDTMKVQNSISGYGDVSDLEAGNYKVVVTDNGQCGTMAVPFEIAQPSPVIAAFTANDTVIYLGDSIHFRSYSSNATTFLWDFGDGNRSGESSPAHLYENTGSYAVKLFAYNGNCLDSAVREIQVTDINPIVENLPDHTDLTAYFDGSSIVVRGRFSEGRSLHLSLTDAQGQVIWNRDYLRQTSVSERIPGTFAKGIYFLNATGTDKGSGLKIVVY